MGRGIMTIMHEDLKMALCIPDDVDIVGVVATGHDSVMGHVHIYVKHDGIPFTSEMPKVYQDVLDDGTVEWMIPGGKVLRWIPEIKAEWESND